MFFPIQINVGREHIHAYIYRQLLSAIVEKWLLFRIVKIPKDNISFCSLSQWVCEAVCFESYSVVTFPMIQQSIQTVFQQQYRGKNEKWTLMKLLSWMSLSALYWSHSTCCWLWWKEIFSFRLYWYTLNEIVLQEKNWSKQWDSQTLWSQPGFTMLGQSPMPIGTELKCRCTRKIKNHKLSLKDFNILSISVCWYTPLLHWTNLLLFSFSRVLNETLN